MSLTTLESSGSASVTIANGTAMSQVSAAYYPDFRERLYVIASLVAVAVLIEDTGTTSHTSRANYARNVMFDPVTIVDKSICFIVVADGVTGVGSTDQDIANRLGDCWNVLSSGY